MARKILLADDSVTAQNMGRKILADAGYDVVTVNNGSAALKRIAEIKPDLIVLDVYMPGYSGLEVCQRLKDAAETARIPVLLTVGKLEPFKPEEARRVRADAHIVKPFEASELLTAITRLEDRMVPQKSGESAASADTGWASRLSFPSKKKKEAAEPEDVAAGAGFRDFRKGKGKAGAGGASSVTASRPPVQEPVPVPYIPNDITPEELDALSALAAKLDGSTPAAEDTAPPAKQEFESPAAVVEPAFEPVTEPAVEPAVEPAAESLDATFAAEPAPLVEEKNEFQIPVENLQAAVEGCEPVADAAAVEVPKTDLEHSESVEDSESLQDSKSPEDSESQHPETPAPIIAVNAAHFAQEPAPVDSNDEPMFASATSAVEQAAEESMVDQPSEVEEPAPTDAELAEALRLLTPSIEHTDGSTIPSRGTLVAAGQLLAEEAARHAAAGPRWVAEPVLLSPEEAAISLEAEMFRSFAAMPMPVSSSTAEPESVPIVGVSGIAAAVENRLAEAGLAPNSTVLPDGAESCSETTANEASAEGTPAETMAVAPEATSSAVEEVEAEKTEHQDSPVNVAGQVPAEEPVTEEPLKEELVTTPEVAPKAMAAAAAADGGASASDANAIANIVDSMLADLRPKLLEEIAKKMAKK